MIRAGVIGVGSMGKNHARVYAELETVDLVAVADIDRVAGERVARSYGTSAYIDYQEMLDRESLDVVTVAVPTTLHLEVAREVIIRGVNLLIEKPIASTVEEGEEIVAEAEARGMKLMIGHIERFNPAISELKRRLDNGELDRVFQIHATRLGPLPPRVSDVGVVIDLATHDLDIMRYLLGADIKRIYSETQRRMHVCHEDLVVVLLRFEDGVVGVLNINWLTPTKARELSVTGERGMFRVDYLTQDLYFFENDYVHLSNWHSLSVIRGVSEGNMIKIRVEKREPLKAELESFIEAVASDREPTVSGRDGIQALALAQQVLESGRSSRVVSFQANADRAREVVL